MQQQTQQIQQQSNQIQQLLNAINIRPTVPMNVQLDPAQSLSQITPANSNSATSPQAKSKDSNTATTVSSSNSSLKRKADNSEPAIDDLQNDAWKPTDEPPTDQQMETDQQ